MDMKKLYIITALIFMALSVSCNQEEMVNKSAGGERVSISAELPGDVAATRAQIEVPATHKLRCIIEVWEADRNPDLKYRKEIAVEGGTIPTFDFALKPGDYNCLVWADFIRADAAITEVTVADDITYTHFEDTYYDTSNLNEITVKDAGGSMLFDTELCDGFYMNMELKKSESAVQKAVKLVRPFAKLIVKENEAGKFAGLEHLRVNYEMPKTFNVATGEPGTEMLAAVYDKSFAPEDNSQILFTGYIFTPSIGFSMGSAILSFKTESGTVKCEIPEGSITLKRNQQLVAGGNLISGGGIEPEPEPVPGDELHVGDYFFIDGTWSSELTESNKDNCVGIVYAVGVHPEDNTGNYGVEAGGKSIRGYVMALKNTGIPAELFPEENSRYLLNNSRPYFYMQKEGGGGKDDAVTVFTKGNDPDWTKYDGYGATHAILTEPSYSAATDKKHYPALLVFEQWKETAEKPQNSSGWYIPASGQLYEAVGKCYGFTLKETDKDYADNVQWGAENINEDMLLLEALLTAIDMGIATNFPANENAKGYYVYTSSLSNDAMPMAIQVGAEQVTSLYPKPNYKTQGIIRPFLTIIK